MKKVAELAFTSIFIVIGFLVYLGFKLSIKFGLIAGLEGLGLPRGVALIVGFLVGALIIAGLAHIFKPLGEKISAWAEKEE